MQFLMLCFSDSIKLMEESLETGNVLIFPVQNKCNTFSQFKQRNTIQMLIRNLLLEIKFMMLNICYSQNLHLSYQKMQEKGKKKGIFRTLRTLSSKYKRKDQDFVSNNYFESLQYLLYLCRQENEISHVLKSLQQQKIYFKIVTMGTQNTSFYLLSI